MPIRNSAKCIHCEVEIESKHRHDFVTHTCAVHKIGAREWYTDSDGVEKIRDVVPFKQTWNFFVDGGKDYIRRGGDLAGYEDTSIYGKDTQS